MSHTIPAHFDGQHVEDDAWRALSAKRLQGAYTDDEEDYLVELVKVPNAEY